MLPTFMPVARFFRRIIWREYSRREWGGGIYWLRGLHKLCGKAGPTGDVCWPPPFQVVGRRVSTAWWKPPRRETPALLVSYGPEDSRAHPGASYSTE